MAMAAKTQAFNEEEMSIHQNLGYPRAYSKLCIHNNNSRNYTSPYINGPPLSFLPYTLQPHEALRAKDSNQMFPIIDPEVKSTANPRGYVNLLWKQLDHLGNAGFDPSLFRVDPYGNVLYLHADPASPLAWDIDHWFPCSRGGRTVPSNLRLVQWQVCEKKKNKLEFLVPWWDLQLGISVNQFLSIFASKNSDFRNRAFSFLFAGGGSEELNALQAVESHKFPQHFLDMKKQIGLAPAAMVSKQKSSDSSVLKSLDINKSLRHNSPFPGIKKFTSKEDDSLNMSIQRFRSSKENENPETDDFSANPYLSITRARDSLKQREECKKKEAEMIQMEDELNELRQKNEEERVALQDLEALLIKRRRRVEKCRRLAEAQSSYRSMLEKMIRDAMHQSVVYKEQLRLNHAATSALMARLEAQRATCDNAENELRRKFNQRDEIEKKIMRSCWEEQARKRLRMDYTLFEERNEDCIKGRTPPKKELRVFLQEEQKASDAGLSPGEKEKEEEEDEDFENRIDAEKDTNCKDLVLANSEVTELKFGVEPTKKTSHLQRQEKELEEDHENNDFAVKGKDAVLANDEKLKFREGSCSKSTKPKKNISYLSDEKFLDFKLSNLAIRESSCGKNNEISEERDESKKQSFHHSSSNDVEDEEHRKQVGKGNVEKWLQLMLENAKEGSTSSTDSSTKDSDREENSTATEIVQRLNRINPEKEIKLLKLKPFENRKSSNDETCESSRGFRSVPSSPLMVLGRSVDCIGLKPKVMGDQENEANLDSMASNSSKFIKTCTRTIKRAVNK